MMTTLLDRPRRALRRRWEMLADERGSLPLALLIIAVGMALAAGILPTLIVQDRATVFDNTRLDNLAAAESGIQVVAGKMRAATASATTGNAALLPCTAAAPITGSVNAVGNARYSVLVSYFLNDPVANPPPPAGTNTPMVCSAGYGAYDAATASFVPSYALITSTGTDGATATSGGSQSRTIVRTYVFQTTNRNVAGGVIRIFPPTTNSSVSWCIDAGGSPIVRTVVTLQTCSTSDPPIGQQLFFYRSDLTIQLLASVTSANPKGLCLDTDTGLAGPAVTSKIILNQCTALGTPPFALNVPPFSQQWSFNDQGGFSAATAATSTSGLFTVGTYASGLCLNAPSQAAGQTLNLAGCGTVSSSPTQSWLPSPFVGDGAAPVTDPLTGAQQLVNYQQFGRCLDVAATSVAANTNYLQAYPCKQNPRPASVLWNQKFSYDPVHQWIDTTYTDGTLYCLVSPWAEGGQVRLTQCTNPGYDTGVTAAQLLWIKSGVTSTTSYAQRYTYVDKSSAARCLSIDDPALHPPWSNAVVATCSSSTAQKWNGDANLGVSVFKNEIEAH